MNKPLDKYKEVKYELPEKAHCWQLDGAGFDNLKLVEIPRKKPGPDEIAFRTDANGICFSDVKIINAGPSHPRLQKYDIAKNKVVPGHELTMTVVEVGENVKDRFSIGDRYIVQADMMKYGKAVGYDIWGGFCDYGVFGPEVQEFLIPVDEMRAGYSESALVEPWACVEASYARVDFGPLDHCIWLVGGAGPMGQMHLVRTFYAKISGQAPNMQVVVLTDISDERLAMVKARYDYLAQEAGVTYECLNPNSPDFEKKMDELAPNGFDFEIGLVPVPEVIQASMKRLRPYGVMNLFAGLKRGTGPLTMGDIHYDQITLTGNSGSRIEDMKEVLRKVEAGNLATNESVYAVVGLEEAKKGVEQVRDGVAMNKIIIYPHCKDLPLTPITELADKLPFPDKIKSKVKKGHWTKDAEEVLLNNKLAIN